MLTTAGRPALFMGSLVVARALVIIPGGWFSSFGLDPRLGFVSNCVWDHVLRVPSRNTIKGLTVSGLYSERFVPFLIMRGGHCPAGSSARYNGV